jgi:hypothetical protein
LGLSIFNFGDIKMKYLDKEPGQSAHKWWLILYWQQGKVSRRLSVNRLDMYNLISAGKKSTSSFVSNSYNMLPKILHDYKVMIIETSVITRKIFVY